MSLKRLSEPSGEVADVSNQQSDISDSVDREIILVHTGPEGEAIEFMSGDGPISFDEARIKALIDVNNKAYEALAADYGGEDKIPIGANTPLLDQHSDDSNDRIRGRLLGPLKFLKRDIPKVGKNCACAVRLGRFLGKESVERVKDGRIYHFSIGIDDETNVISEVSTVIEPAAAGAMLLNKGKALKGDKTMSTKKTKKLAAMKLAHEKRKTTFAQFKEGIIQMSTKLVTTSDGLKLAKRQSEVGGRLFKLMASKKLTPAEFKKMDVKKLAALHDEALNTVLETFEARENVIMPGQKGTSQAESFANLGQSLEKRQQKRLKSETKKELMRMGAKLKSGADEDEMDMGGGNQEQEVAPRSDEHAVPGQQNEEKELAAAHLSHLSEEIGKHLEAGDLDEAKKAHEELKKHLSGHKEMSGEFGSSDVKSEDEKQSLEKLQTQIDELKTQLSRWAGMVDELVGAEEEEGHDLAAVEEEEQPVGVKA